MDSSLHGYSQHIFHYSELSTNLLSMFHISSKNTTYFRHVNFSGRCYPSCKLGGLMLLVPW